MQTGLERIAENPLSYCESTAEEARAGNLQAGFCEGCAPQGARLLAPGGVRFPRATRLVITVSDHHTKRGWTERALQRLREQIEPLDVEWLLAVSNG